MPIARLRVVALASLLSIVHPAIAGLGQPAAVAPPARSQPEAWRTGRSPALLAILDEHFAWTLRENPSLAIIKGEDRYNALLRDVSAAAVERRARELDDRLTRLAALDPSGLTEADRLDADLLRDELELARAGRRFFDEQTPIDARFGPQVTLPNMVEGLPFTTPAHYDDFAARLEKVPAYIDATIAQMRAGVAAGRVPPRVSMVGAAEACEALGSEDAAASPSISPFFKPYLSLPADHPAAARARRAIAEGVVPAFRTLAAFLRGEYVPACRESVGASEGVDGVAAYDHALRLHTSTAMTAEEIHALGLSEVARIRAEMFGVIARTDYPRRDELPGDELFAAFVQHLRTDPRFYYTDAEELLTDYRDICKRMDAEMPRLFGRLPRLSYGVKEIPPLQARTSPTAYYWPGSLRAGLPAWFVANTHRLDQRPKYEMIALALHEAVPGHHLQIALAEELEGVHPFRTLRGSTAFVEGWALYSERLGLEVGGTRAAPPAAASVPEPVGESGGTGFYADPYDDFGRLTYEMWRACRLVVDTGVHAKGWSRQRAIDYMLANTALSPLNIEREVDRYIAWPGQACAYKIGELKIRELRARAETALGERFDVRAFHDAVLGAGAIPLPVLESRIDRWIADKGR